LPRCKYRKVIRSIIREILIDYEAPHYAVSSRRYASPHIIRAIKSRKMRWAGHAARMGDMRNAYTILVGKSEGKEPLGRLEDNIRTDLGI
jgi:hypothetical protein